MANIITQSDILLLKQRNKEIYIKVQLLNTNFKPIDELQGELIEGSFSISADSDIRRTCNFRMNFKNDSYIFGEQSKLWLDKYVKLFIGFKSQRLQSVIYYNLGIYAFSSSQYTLDTTSKTLSLSCSDMVTKLNGTFGGTINALNTKIPVESTIRSALVDAICQFGGISNFIVDEIGEYYDTAEHNKVPYDLEFSTGVAVWEIVSELRDLYPGWETFFDVDGTFICQMIPTAEFDDIVLDASIMSDLVISEQISHDYSRIKNVTKVFGKVIDADRYADVCTNTGNQYAVTLTEFQMTTNIVVAVKVNVDNADGMTLKINEETPYPITDCADTALVAGTLKADTAYCFRFSNQVWEYLGQHQVSAITKNENPDSPYCIAKIGERLQVLSSGIYDNLDSDSKAQQTADYENWKVSRLTDDITLTMLLVPWLDVNQKVEYTTKTTKETNQYMIKQISGDLTSGTMTVTMSRFYPLYPNIISK